MADKSAANVAASAGEAKKTGSAKKNENGFIRFMKKFMKRKEAVAASCFIILLVILTILSPYICKYGYAEMNLTAMKQPPSAEHLLGTDHLGRDILSRILYGARYSMSIGILAVCATAFFSIILGSIAGYFGGAVDNLIMRLMDVLHAIPSILLAIIISSVLGSGFVQTVFAIGIGGIANHSRTIRAQFLTTRNQEFVEAAQSINCSKPRIIFKHVLPNSITPYLVHATIAASHGLISSATLSYIGLGVQPPMPEWGAMLSDADAYVRTSPYMMIAPGLFIMVTVMCLNIIGSAIRDILDPKLHK